MFCQTSFSCKKGNFGMNFFFCLPVCTDISRIANVCFTGPHYSGYSPVWIILFPVSLLLYAARIALLLTHKELEGYGL